MIQKIYTDKVVMLVAVLMAAIFVLGYEETGSNIAAASPLSYHWERVGRVNGVDACVDTHNVIYRSYADTPDGLCHLTTYVRLSSPEIIRENKCVVEETQYLFDKNVRDIRKKVKRRVVAEYDNTARVIYVDRQSKDIGRLLNANRRIDEEIVLKALEAYQGRIIGR